MWLIKGHYVVDVAHTVDGLDTFRLYGLVCITMGDDDLVWVDCKSHSRIN